jgi:putative FmdB family regulatory protein
MDEERLSLTPVVCQEAVNRVIVKNDEGGRTTIRRMPIYEFECEACGEQFEELVAAGAAVACRECGSKRTRRLYSNLAPPGRQPRGAKVRADESRRREREAARQNRIADSRKRRSLGEKP